MKGLEINDLLKALMANYIVINDDIYKIIKEIEHAGDRLVDECNEPQRQLTATITFSYAAHDYEDDDPQPAPVETPILVDLKPSPVETPQPRKFKDGDEPYVTNGKRSHFGEQIMVAGYTFDDYVISVDGDTYREDELEPAD